MGHANRIAFDVNVILLSFGDQGGRIGWRWLAKPIRNNQE
jgi:hypothetical protein